VIFNQFGSYLSAAMDQGLFSVLVLMVHRNVVELHAL